ncbi:MAG: hypothetical protein PHU44_16550 [Syntrophales bacterium]|nr:hypothetical protein [Syntrophales bacterium]
MRKPVIFAIIIAVLAGGAILGGYLYQQYKNSPRYALQQMVLALQAKDMDKLFNYLDIKEIFQNLAEESTKSSNELKDQSDEWTNLGRQLGRKFARQIFPKLYDSFETQIKQALVSYLKDLSNTEVLALTAAVATAKIEVQGEEAQVTVYDPKNHRPMRFRMRRAPEDGSWQVVSLNYNDFKHLLKKEFFG